MESLGFGNRELLVGSQCRWFYVAKSFNNFWRVGSVSYFEFLSTENILVIRMEVF